MSGRPIHEYGWLRRRTLVRLYRRNLAAGPVDGLIGITDDGHLIWERGSPHASDG